MPPDSEALSDLTWDRSALEEFRLGDSVRGLLGIVLFGFVVVPSINAMMCFLLFSCCDKINTLYERRFQPRC